MAQGGGAPIQINAHRLQISDTLMAGSTARFLAGLELRSPNDAFGGLSGLHLQGPLMRLIGDRGVWVEARVNRAASGAISGFGAASIGRLRGSSGNPLQGTWIDAESLAEDGRGGYWIGFERRHRLTRHRGLDGKALAVLEPPKRSLGRNAGVEGLAHAGDGALWAIAEAAGPNGRQRGWRMQGGAAEPFSFARIGPFDSTGADFGPDGALYLLERRFGLLTGVGMRIRRFTPALIEAVARGEQSDLGDGETLVTLDTRAPIDNMEGLSVERRDDGLLVLTAISDDNFNRLQRTVLLQFVVEPFGG